LQDLANEVGDSKAGIFQLALQVPGVITPPIALPSNTIPAACHDHEERVRKNKRTAAEYCVTFRLFPCH